MTDAFYVFDTYVYSRAFDSALESCLAAAAAAAAAEKVWALERHHMKPSSDLQLLQL